MRKSVCECACMCVEAQREREREREREKSDDLNSDKAIRASVFSGYQVSRKYFCDETFKLKKV